MIYFFKRLSDLMKAVLPLMLLYVLFVCALCGIIGTDFGTAAMWVFGGTFFFIIVTSACAFSDTSRIRRNSVDSRIIGGCFGGFSRKSRLFASGLTLLKSGIPDEAADTLLEARSLNLTDKERAVLAFYLGSCYRTMGYPTNAANYYSEAVDRGIDSDYAYIFAARCLVAGGRFDKAMEIYEGLLKRDSVFEYIYTDMGMCCLKDHDPDKALYYFELSADKGMNYSFSLGGCSLAYLMKKDVDTSREYFAKALINNLNDINGFRKYYCSIAEAEGILDKIDEYMKKYPDNTSAEAEYDRE